MTTNTNTSAEIDVSRDLIPADVTALRTCDSVSFHHTKGIGFIRAMLNAGIGEPRVYTAREQMTFPETEDVGSGERARIIACDSGIYCFNDGDSGSWTHRDAPRAGCFAVINSALFNDEWPTIASLLRAGDQLGLKWIGDNNNGYLRTAQLHRDELKLVVTRGKRRMTFAVDNSVCEDNTARMIRRHV